MNSLSCIYYHSPIPFLVLHRVWAGEGNFEKQNPLSLSWCYTEFGQGRAAGLGDVTIEQVCIIVRPETPLSLSWCYTELGQGRAAGFWVR